MRTTSGIGRETDLMGSRMLRVVAGVGVLAVLGPTAAVGVEPDSGAPIEASGTDAGDAVPGEEYDGPFGQAPDPPQYWGVHSGSARLDGTFLGSPGVWFSGTRLSFPFDGAGVSVEAGEGSDFDTFEPSLDTFLDPGEFVFLRVRPGSTFEISGGFQAETLVEAWLFPAGVHLASTTADHRGAAAFTFQIPADLAACSHAVYLRGMFDRAIINDVGGVIFPADPDGRLIEYTVGMGVLPHPYPFADIATSSPHRLAVGCLADRGVTRGTSATTFSPWQPVTRGQAASLLARDAGLVDPGASHLAAAKALAAIGVMQGDEDGDLQLKAPLTRGQAASLLARLHQLEQPGYRPFADSGGGHRGAIAALAQRRVVHGYDDGTFRPNNPVGRAAFASMMFRLEERLPRTP